MIRGVVSAAMRRVDRFLDLTFFAAMEVSALSLPTLWFLLFADPAGPVSLSAMTALCTAPPAVAAYRGGYVGSAAWPWPGQFGTMPARSAYYGLVVGGATYLGVAAQLAWESFLPGMVVPAVACAVALAALPRALDALSRAARLSV